MIYASTGLLLLALGSQLTQTVSAWGLAGHEIVATIAQIHLHPTTSAKLCGILPEYAKCRLAPVAGWADKVRPWYRWSSTMHYVGDTLDHPGDHCSFGEGRWENPNANVLLAVQNMTNWLRDDHPGAEEALKFLIHFVGDLHQPLHLTGRDRGGNNMKVRFDGRITNLHSVWDSSLISKSLRTISLNYTRPLPVSKVENALTGAIYDPYIRQIMWEGVMGRWESELTDWLFCPSDLAATFGSTGQQILSGTAAAPSDDGIVCPFHWAKPMHDLNCEIIWPAELDQPNREPHHYVELDKPEYTGRIKKEWLVEKQLARAGIRLAGILNYLYMDEEALTANV